MSLPPGTPPAPPPDDALDAVVAAARGGSVAAFNTLVGAYQAAAYHVAYRILGDGELAADATQDAVLAAYRAIGKFRGASFRVWLLRIVTNQCLDALRARRRRPSISLDALVAAPGHDAPAGSDGLPLADAAWDPVALAEQHELSAALQRGLATLPEDQRVAVVLSDVEGLSYEEIAAVTGANLGTVKSRIARGRGRLRDFLEQHRELLPRNYRHSTRAEPPARSPDNDGKVKRNE